MKGNFMKKLTVIACLSTMFLSPVAQADWQGNWLLGLSAGYNWYDAELDLTIDLPAGPLFFANHREFDTNRWSFGILGGYQIKCDGWLFGAELNVDWAEKNNTQNYVFTGDTGIGLLSFAASADYKNEATFALTGRVGYDMLCWLMPYLRAGIETNRNKLDISIEEINTGTQFITDISNQSYRFVGGVGVEMPVPTFSGFTVRAEYNYHARNRTLNDSRAWQAPAVAASTVTSRSFENSAKLSFVYNFNI